MISFAPDRTAPNSPSLPEMIMHGIWNHSPMSQNLATRFQTSAAGRLTSISIATEVYDGLGVCSGGGGGAWAAAIAVRHAYVKVVQMRFFMGEHYHGQKAAGACRLDQSTAEGQ